MASAVQPSGLLANSGIELFTFITPNCWKISVMLEELKALYDLKYTFQNVDISQNIQKQPWFVKLNPNGRIPVIVDHDNNGFVVFESAAILSYLVRRYDTNHQLSFTEEEDTSAAEQWIAWGHSGVGPIQGQTNHFYRFTTEKSLYAVQRFNGELERLYGVLDSRLLGREYLVGDGVGKFSIVDISIWPWINSSCFAGIKPNQFPNVEKWWKRILQRPAVQQAIRIPFETTYVNESYLKRIKDGEEEEFRSEEEQLAKYLTRAREQYNYVFKSP